MSNETDLAHELGRRDRMRQVVAMDASGYVVKRIGPYEIIEGTGPDGGDWFARGKGETKRFRSRADAEGHAEASAEDDEAAIEGQQVKPAVEGGEGSAKPKKPNQAQDAALSVGDKVRAKSSNQGMRAGTVYTVTTVKEKPTAWGNFVTYELDGHIDVVNGHLLLERV